MTKAYVLVETTTGQVRSVAEALSHMPGLVSVDSVAGPYDVIVVLEGEDLGTVGDLVTEHVHAVGGIVHTVTCLVVS